MAAIDAVAAQFRPCTDGWKKEPPNIAEARNTSLMFTKGDMSIAFGVRADRRDELVYFSIKKIIKK